MFTEDPHSTYEGRREVNFVKPFRKVTCGCCKKEFLKLKHTINLRGKRLKVCNNCASIN